MHCLYLVGGNYIQLAARSYIQQPRDLIGISYAYYVHKNKI